MRKRFLEGFHYDAHPMGILVSAVAALSTFYPEAKDIFDPDNRYKQIIRLIAKMPTLAAAAHRFSVGMPFVYPDNSLAFAPNFLSMMWKTAEPRFEADPVLSRAIDVLFILHADHEQNCSTTAMRVVGSSHVDPYSACAAACAALYGPRHGGANEQVIRMLTEIGSLENVPDFVRAVKEGHGRLQGFGHRVYKHYDPRATIIRDIAYEVFEVTGKNPLLDIALEARGGCARRRVLHLAQALPERRLLLRPDLPGDGLPARDVPGPVRDPAHRRMAGALGRDARARHEDRPCPGSSTSGARGATTCRWRTGSRRQTSGYGRRGAHCHRRTATTTAATPQIAIARRSFHAQPVTPGWLSNVAKVAVIKWRMGK